MTLQKLKEWNTEQFSVANEKLQKEYGGPMLIERNGKFYQIGVNYLSNQGDGFHACISCDCEFIENVTKNEVKCESALPLYDRPYEPTLPQNQEPSSNAPKIIQFQMATFVIVLLIFLCI